MPKEETIEAKFTRWLSDGTSWIGVFENKELYSGPRGTGHKFALVYDIKDWDAAVLEKTEPPATGFGPGFKYRLVAKCKTVSEALASLGSGNIN